MNLYKSVDGTAAHPKVTPIPLELLLGDWLQFST